MLAAVLVVPQSTTFALMVEQPTPASRPVTAALCSRIRSLPSWSDAMMSLSSVTVDVTVTVLPLRLTVALASAEAGRASARSAAKGRARRRVRGARISVEMVAS